MRDLLGPDIVPSQTDIYEFEDFRIDFGEKTLSRRGAIVPITPKVFELLELFVENAGRLVEKDEMMRRIWPDRFVEESNITFNIKMLRKALGDNAQRPQFIQTVQGRGYRFIADVRRVKTESYKNDLDTRSVGFADLTDRNGEIPTPATSRVSNFANFARPRPLALAVIGTLLIAVVGLGFYFRAGKSAGGMYGRKSIAVLPIRAVDKATRGDIYEVGIADSVIHKLGSLNGFILRPLGATRKYADTDQDPIAAGREQMVDYVLASNYQLAAGKIRITAQLYNVGSGQIEEIYKSGEKDPSNIFALEDEVANEIGTAMSARFGATFSKPPADRGTTNEDAYLLYQQAMYLLGKRTSADARRAAEILDQSVALDPNYARAWAGVALVHRSMGNFGGSNTREEYQRSIDAVSKALALDENLPDAHIALCENKMAYEWAFSAAERECRRAIELDSNSSLAHLTYSRLLSGQGRFDDAIAEARTAVDIEPASLFGQRNYGTSLYYARRFPEAVTQFKRLLEMEKGFGSTYNWIIVALELQGKYPEAFEWFIKARAVNFPAADQQEITQAYQTAYATSGWPGMVNEQIRRFEDSKTDPKKAQPPVYFQGSVLYAKAGNKDKAFEHLEQSYEKREMWMSLLKVEPGLESLRSDPRFDELVKRVESK